ncbi:MAG: hypothetical protein LC659_07525, partial [Myxococcales bacterium]|nr:hypothetical protein [Myxococcales bacterium]
AAHRWGQRRFPTTFVVAGGVIKHINRGFGSGYARRLDGWVEKELNSAALIERQAEEKDGARSPRGIRVGM